MKRNHQRWTKGEIANLKKFMREYEYVGLAYEAHATRYGRTVAAVQTKASELNLTNRHHKRRGVPNQHQFNFEPIPDCIVPESHTGEVTATLPTKRFSFPWETIITLSLGIAIGVGATTW